MTKIHIIIDKDGALTGLTCTDLTIERSEPSMHDYPFITPKPKGFYFSANNVVTDESTNLISLPDEILLRIRDHNIDAELKNSIKQTVELKNKIESLKDQVRGWELRRDLVAEEWERYTRLIDKTIDEHPMVAAEIALQDGDLDSACYFAQKANEEDDDNENT